MGELIDGRWITNAMESVIKDGALHRPPSVFRNWITADGASPPEAPGARGFKAEAGRYHLYVSLACPWAHRTLILRDLKGLAGMISISVVNWLMAEDGWTFAPGEGVIPDMVNGTDRLRDIYRLADPHATTRVTVPVLWDKATKTIVSNESAEIIRMFNAAFDDLGAKPGDYYPAPLRGEIDAINARVYASLNNGVYRVGFARRQQAYEEAAEGVFATLDWLEERLSRRPYLVGDQLTEADIRAFTTLVRFDAVYYGHFKCNRRALVDYPALWDYTRALYQHPDIRPTVSFTHIKRHYYMSHLWINPTGIVPIGPDRDFDAPVRSLSPQAGRGH